MIKDSIHNPIKTIHIGKWVALSKDHKKVLGYSSDLKQLYKKIGKNVVYTRPLPNDSVFSF